MRLRLARDAHGGAVVFVHAVVIVAMPGTETLDFNNCVFRGNGVNVENAAGYAVDISQIVTVEN